MDDGDDDSTALYDHKHQWPSRSLRTLCRKGEFRQAEIVLDKHDPCLCFRGEHEEIDLEHGEHFGRTALHFAAMGPEKENSRRPAKQDFMEKLIAKAALSQVSDLSRFRTRGEGRRCSFGLGMVDAFDRTGATALHHAVLRGNAEAVRAFCVSRFCDFRLVVRASDESSDFDALVGLTALEVAKTTEDLDEDVLVLLEEAHAAATGHNTKAAQKRD